VEKVRIENPGTNKKKMLESRLQGCLEEKGGVRKENYCQEKVT